MSNDAMTTADAQAMVEDILAQERGEGLDEASQFKGYKGPAGHKKALAALDQKIAVIDRLEDQNDRTGSIIAFVKMFAKGEKKLLAAAKALETIHDWWGSLPPGANDIRAVMWKRAAHAAKKSMDWEYYNVLKDRLHLPV